MSSSPDTAALPVPAHEGAARFVAGLRRAGLRALGLVAALFALLALTFVALYHGRLDPAEQLVGANATREAYLAARAQLGLDDPLHQQFSAYLGRLAEGDLGRSLLTREPIASDIRRSFAATLELGLLSFAGALVVGLGLGLGAARWRGGWPDRLCQGTVLVGASTPTFWLAMIGLAVLYAQLGWAAGPGRQAVFFEGEVVGPSGLLLLDTALAGRWDAWRDALWHLALPALILALHEGAYIARMVRTLVAAEFGKDYVLTARIKGLSPGLILWRHVLPNVRVPLMAVLTLSLAALLEGAVLTETVFSWPGLGRYLTSSLLIGDLQAVMAASLLVGVIYLTFNVMADALQGWLDPRVQG